MIGSLGLPELIFIFVLALLVFGPKRLPEMGRMIGKGMAEFRKATNELKRTINAEIALEDEEGPAATRRSLSPVHAGTVARGSAVAAADAPISPMAALGGDVVVIPPAPEESGDDVVAETADAAPVAPAAEPAVVEFR